MEESTITGHVEEYIPTTADLEEMADAYILMDGSELLQKLKARVLGFKKEHHELYGRIEPSEKVLRAYQRGYLDALRKVTAVLDLEYGLNPYLYDGRSHDET